MKPFFFIIILICFSCSGRNDVPSGIIKPLEMKKILWDISRAQALAAVIARKDSLINEIAETKVLNEKIFSFYHITADDFNKTYNWYTAHPDVLKIIFDSIGASNQRENEQLIKQKGHSTVPFDFKKSKLKP